MLKLAPGVPIKFSLGGTYSKEGLTLFQILSLRRGTNSKRGPYLKLGSNSSIYGIYLGIVYFEIKIAKL